jgi:hypothetical protein
MLFALCVIAFAMMVGRGAMGFGGVLVMLRCLIVLVSSHWILPFNVCLNQWQPRDVSLGSNSEEFNPSLVSNFAQTVPNQLI